MQLSAKRDAELALCIPEIRPRRCSIAQMTISGPSNYLLNVSCLKFVRRFL